MRFPPQFLDELRARLPVSEVVGKRVRLRKAGREWKGLSPFNKERTPSFFVNDQKGFYHDFSSGKHGDIFTFVMETEGVAFPEAVERLAALAGVRGAQALARSRGAGEPPPHPARGVRAGRGLLRGDARRAAGAKARGYLADRGLDPPTQVKFRIGYAPAERFALKEHLGNLGISVEDMIEAGLLVHGDDIPVPYDRFRNRVMFPIAISPAGSWRSAAARSTRMRRPNTSTPRRRRSSTRARCSTTARRRARPPIAARP